jgi:DNA invertase Pin-like site-specific DNA recombinase
MITPTIALYARVSTDQQKTDSQKLTLKQWTKAQGYTSLDYCWYLDKVTGTTDDRPELQRLIRDVEKGRVKVLAFTRLDRLSRSTIEGLKLLSRFADKGIRVVSVLQGIDFNGSYGKFLASLFLALAELERDTIVSRVKEGLQARKAKGLPMGRPKNAQRHQQIRELHKQGLTASQIATRLGIPRGSIYRSFSDSMNGNNHPA